VWMRRGRGWGGAIGGAGAGRLGNAVEALDAVPVGLQVLDEGRRGRRNRRKLLVQAPVAQPSRRG